MILSLDISTSMIGVAIDTPKLIYYSFNTKKIKKETSSDSTFNSYYRIAEELIKTIPDVNIDTIVIEEPLLNSSNRSTVNKLIIINTIISSLLRAKYNKPIIHQNVNRVRSWILKDDPDKELDVKTRTINVINNIYKIQLTKKDNDAADAIMHLHYFKINNNATTE